MSLNFKSVSSSCKIQKISRQSFMQTSNKSETKSQTDTFLLSSKIQKKVQFSSFNTYHMEESRLNNIHSDNTYSSKTVCNTRISHQEPSSNRRQQKNDFPPLQQLSQADIFQCSTCSEYQSDKKCSICKNKKKVDRNTNFVKFLQYILQFKMKNKQSYQNTKKKKAQKLSVNSHCDQFYQGLNQACVRQSINSKSSSMTLNDFKQKISIRSSIHRGYKCDSCDIEPIEGIRYHCMHPDCEDDHDLCEHCYLRNGHRHEQYIKQIKSNGVDEKLQNFINVLQQSTNLSRSSNISSKTKTKQPQKRNKNASSSIR